MKFKSYSSNELHQTTVVSNLTETLKKQKNIATIAPTGKILDHVERSVYFLYAKSFYHFNTTKNTITPYIVRQFFFAENKNK